VLILPVMPSGKPVGRLKLHRADLKPDRLLGKNTVTESVSHAEFGFLYTCRNSAVGLLLTQELLMTR
jgi:hypothetical protein